MDQETLNTLMSMVILPLLLALSGFAVAWLRKKTQEITDRKSTRLKLQSHSDLVCRLLLEKKNFTKIIYTHDLTI